MIGRRAAVGLSLLSALLSCAFAVQSASAKETESTNTTAVTCVKEDDKTGEFKDEHCDSVGTPGKEEFRHSSLKMNVMTELEGDNEKVTESTKKSESAIIRMKIGATTAEITCEQFVTTSGWIENFLPQPRNHKSIGTLSNFFDKCTVKKPEKCTVKQPISSAQTIRGVDGLKGPKAGEENAMGIRFRGHGLAGGGSETEVWAIIRFEGEECSIGEFDYPIKGSAIATSGPTTESSQSNEFHGSTLIFTPKFEMQNLYIFEQKNTVELETIHTLRMAEEEGKEGKQNPITFTTFLT